MDGDQRVVGANRVARKSLLLDDRGLHAGVSLWTIFERDLELFRRKDKADIATRLVIAGSRESRSALVTPPMQPFADWRNTANAALHARPRLDVIGTLGTMAPAPQAHGGLSPAAMRRVRGYVDAHLGVSIDLATLAGVAGVSIHHFARGFKQSVGVTPHHYLTQKRLERTQDLLAHADLSLSDGCVCRGVFRPKPPGASLPSDARRHARTVPVGAALKSVETSPPDGALDHWQSADRQAYGRGGTPRHRKTFGLFRLAVFHHAGAIRVDLHIAPGDRRTSEP